MTVDQFEYVTDDEKSWAFDIEGFDDTCELTKSNLVPHLVGAIRSKARKMTLVVDDDDDGDDDDQEEEEEAVVSSNATIEKQLEGLIKDIGKESAAFIDMGEHISCTITSTVVAIKLSLTLFNHAMNHRALS